MNVGILSTGCETHSHPRCSNGFQLCRDIRADPQLRQLPIIVVTAMERESDRYWGLKQGADDYLVKPVDGDTLRDKVRALLS